MPIRMICPSCRSTLLLADEFAGKAVRCKKCQNVSKVPGAGAAAISSALSPANPRGSQAGGKPTAAPRTPVRVEDEVDSANAPPSDKKKAPASSGAKIGLIALAGCGALMLLTCGVGGGIFALVKFNAKDSSPSPPLAAANTPAPPPAPQPDKNANKLPEKPAQGNGPPPQVLPDAPPKPDVPAEPELLPGKATVGQRFRYQLPKNEANAQFRLVSAPPGFGLSATGVIQWLPAGTAVGMQQFSVRVTTTTGESIRRYKLEVMPSAVVVQPPGMERIRHGSTLPQKAKSGTPFTFQMPDYVGKSFELVTGPSGLTITPTGRIEWTPGPGLTRLETLTVRVDGRANNVFKINVEESNTGALSLANLGGWIMLPDGVTLIVSLPEQAKLVYLDTVAFKEIKRVDLTFKPAALAYQGKQLFAAVQGAALLHILDLDSGEDKKEIKIPDSAVFDLACHPEKGMLYATTNTRSIVAIDPIKMTATATKARGMFLAIDPVKGDTLYSAIQPEIKDVLVIQELSGNRFRISSQMQGDRALLAKLTISKTNKLRVIAVNPNTAANGYLVRLSPDGKRVAVVGGGGYRPPHGAVRGGISYGIGVFGTDDLNALQGQIECGAYPKDLAFHPVLPLGVAVQDAVANRTLHLFNSGSLAKITAIAIAGAPGRPPMPGQNPGRLVTFGAKGSKLLFYDPSAGVLRSIEIPLSEQDKEKLKKAYEK